MLILRTAQGGGGDSSGRRHGHGGVWGQKGEWYVGGTVQRAVREVELAELSVGVGPRLGSMVDGSSSL